MLALCGVAFFQRDSLAFTLGVTPGGPAIALAPGNRGCQTPISVPPGGDFDHVVLSLGTYGRPGPAAEVDIRDSASRALLGQGTIAAGYPDIAREPRHLVAVGRVPAGRQIDVCVTNRGNRHVAVFGNADLASRTSTALRNGQPSGVDMSIAFRRAPRSVLSLVGLAAQRAALFKFGWTAEWMLWVLGLLVLVCVPALLVRAVATATK